MTMNEHNVCNECKRPFVSPYREMEIGSVQLVKPQRFAWMKSLWRKPICSMISKAIVKRTMSVLLKVSIGASILIAITTAVWLATFGLHHLGKFANDHTFQLKTLVDSTGNQPIIDWACGLGTVGCSVILFFILRWAYRQASDFVWDRFPSLR